MKRWKLLSVILLLLLLSTAIPIDAQENANPKNVSAEEEIKKPASPKAAPRSVYVVPLLFATAILFTGYAYMEHDSSGRIELFIETVQLNSDQSMTVTCGYKSDQTHVLMDSDSQIKIRQGTAIIMEKNPVKSKSMIAVINQNTKLIWMLKNQSIEIDGDKLMNIKKEELWKRS